MNKFICVLIGIFLGFIALAGAVWKWGDKLNIHLADRIAESYKARARGEVTVERLKTESIRFEEVIAKFEDAESFSIKQEKKAQDRMLEYEKAAVKARIETNRLKDLIQPPTTPPPATPPPVIPLSERGKILPETAPTTPPPPTVQVANRGVGSGGQVLRIKKGDWFFYTVDRCGNPTLVTTGDLPEVRLEPGESAEEVKTYFAKLLRGAKVVREISGQDLSDFTPMGHLKVKGKEIPIYGIPYSQAEQM